MLLCQKEKEYLAAQTHRVLVKVLTRRIDELARQMGFSEAEIRIGTSARRSVTVGLRQSSLNDCNSPRRKPRRETSALGPDTTASCSKSVASATSQRLQLIGKRECQPKNFIPRGKDY